MYKPNKRNLEILKNLQESVNEIIEPLEFALLKMNLRPNIGTGLSAIRDELNTTAYRFFIAANKISEKEAELFFDFSWFFNIDIGVGLDQSFPLDARTGAFQSAVDSKRGEKVVLEAFQNVPCIRALEIFDVQHGTNYSEIGKKMFFRFANSLVKIDGNVTAKEERELNDFKEILYSPELQQRALSGEEKYAPYANKSSSGNLEKRELNDLLAELSLLVGLDRVKGDVTQLVNFLKVQQLREAKGLPSAPISRHLVFYGNPGTGKTTVARLLSNIYKSLGILSKGHLIETDRAGLVAGYVGQTALKVKEVAEKALGGILFIDEAYTLSSGGGQDYGQEAIDTLLKFMEDNRDDFIVVVAGYTEKMESFLSSNPGLRSRFNKFLNFDDYNPQQLGQIFELFSAKAGFQLSDKANQKVEEIFTALFEKRDETFGNGRLARNIFEMTINNQANRIITLPNIDEKTLSLIEDKDIPIGTESALG
jgi:SpoVK/Ycf46/Vps4 family AAA+-type ATPase